MKFFSIAITAAVVLYGFTIIQRQNNHPVIDETARQQALKKKQVLPFRAARILLRLIQMIQTIQFHCLWVGQLSHAGNRKR